MLHQGGSAAISNLIVLRSNSWDPIRTPCERQSQNPSIRGSNDSLGGFRVNGASACYSGGAWYLCIMNNQLSIVSFQCFFVWCCLWKRALPCIFIILCEQTGFPNCNASDGYRWVVDSALRTLDTQRQRLEDREAFPPTASWLSYGLAMCHQSW